MDSATFLTVVIILVAIVLVAVGVYLLLILHEARQSLRKINKMIDRVDKVADFVETKIINPTSNISSIALVIKEGIDFFRDLRKTLHQERKSEKENQS